MMLETTSSVPNTTSVKAHGLDFLRDHMIFRPLSLFFSCWYSGPRFSVSDMRFACLVVCSAIDFAAFLYTQRMTGP